jgi:hypothetical protein
MPYRFVRAQPKRDRLSELYDRLDDGEIAEMQPFGNAMTKALQDARFDPEIGEAVWVEEDYCSPPLAMERDEVLDEYFDSLTIVDEDVDEATGWNRLNELPHLREQVLPGARD